MALMPPIDLQKWIVDHRADLTPPVSNKLVYEDSDLIIMMIGANAREDYHVNQTEELFYQVVGNINLKIIENNNEFKTISIKEGELFLLPKCIPHSPQRPKDTVGLVIEHKRKPSQEDGFQWYCEHCGSLIYEEYIHVHDIVNQLPIIFDHFYKDPNHKFCKQCGYEVIPDA